MEILRAHAFEHEGRTDLAIGVYREVLRAYPANRRAREALARLEPQSGKPAPKGPSQRHVRELTALLRQGHHSQLAERALALTRQFPSAAILWNLLGVARLGLGEAVEAEAALRKAVQLAPASPEPLANLGNALIAQDRVDDAIACYRQALEIAPDVPGVLNNLGSALRQEDRSEEAEACFRRALEIVPDFAAAWKNLGGLLKERGEIDAAVAAYQAAIELRSDDAGSHMNLSQIRRFEPGDPQLAAMLELRDQTELDDAQAAYLGFALAKAYEDLGDLGKAFSCLGEANARRRRELGYDRSRDVRKFARIRAAAEAMDAIRLTGPVAAVTPVLVLGMPRSGTTLVEQILCSHSRVAGGGELSYLQNAFNGPIDRDQAIDRDLLSEVRSGYLERLGKLARGASHCTDKMPHNFTLIGFIAAALPEAAIVHVERDARAVCWSNYSHYFTTSSLGYACDLRDTVAHYRLYRDLMAFWNERLPGRIYTLNYEVLTEDPEGEVRNLLEHLGLDWEDACLAFHRNPRSVRTASQLQVRQKIYRGSSESWRRYEPWIGDAFDGL